MNKIFLYFALIILATGCLMQSALQVQVTPLGDEPAEFTEQHIYALPLTVLKVEVVFEELISMPGPYWEYAEKYLGIQEFIRQKSNQWKIHDVSVAPHTEVDPQHFYSINVLKGNLSVGFLDYYRKKGILADESELVQEEVKGIGLGSTLKKDYLRYLDLGIYTNFDEKIETMYKTLVTDTSFLRVPVQRTVVEQKSHAMKAQEAAEFILEIRTRRFELLTGEYEAFPNGEAMEAALHKLDELEESYLSLFIGKTISTMKKRAYFIVPDSGFKPSRYRLDMFSNQLGFVPPELGEGNPLEVLIEPMRKTISPANYFSESSTNHPYNKLIYRLPDVVDLKVVVGEQVLSNQRISIFQSGDLVTSPIGVL